MIHFLVTRRHAYTIESFLQSWGASLRGRVQWSYYPQWLARRTQESGIYVFSDIERLGPPWRRLVVRKWNRLAARGLGYRLVNHPVRSLRRYDLLCRLHTRGVNEHRVFRPREVDDTCRFPVFVRGENDHEGCRGPLLQDSTALRAALRPQRRRWTRSGWLVVEFCDTADANGVYRKYSAFRIGNQIVPRHLMFSRNWMIKRVDLDEARLLAEEEDYVSSNPHSDELMEIFEMAEIEYGRIDYAFRGDRIEVWEINTNPMIASNSALKRPARRKTTQMAVDGISKALLALEEPR